MTTEVSIMDGEVLRRSVCEVLGPGTEVTVVVGRQGQVDVRLDAAQWQRIRDALTDYGRQWPPRYSIDAVVRRTKR